MREIKFRAFIDCSKTNYPDKIVYWNLMDTTCTPPGVHNIIPESVGQFTGLKDKNGKEIYEGDILRFKSWRDALQRLEEKTMEVKYLSGFFTPLVSFGDGPSSRDFEVIGNIFENPELLK